SVPLTVLRNGKSETLHATVGELTLEKDTAAAPSGERSRGKYGMSVQPLTPDVAEDAGVPRGTQGVIVTDVDPSGLAADSQLQKDDVIEKVDGKAVRSGED